MNSVVKKVLKHCESHAFLKPIWDGTFVDHYKFGPAGEFLVNNIRHEWLYSNVTSRDENVFPFHSGIEFSKTSLEDLKEPFNYIKSLNNGQLPFGIAEMRSSHVCKEHHEMNSSNIFTPKHQTVLRTAMFVAPSEARQYYYSWQRQRKMWWRKFSVAPGRFSLADIRELDATGKSQSSEKKFSRDIIESLHTVDIHATFDFGIYPVETVRLHPPEALCGELKDDNLDFKARDGRKNVVPCIIESMTSIEAASLVFLCDAFSDSPPPRQLLRLHRRLAPFKASFAASAANASVGDKLRDLAQHLSGQLRQSGLITLLLPDMARKSLESQYARNDEMGVPFTIVLSDSTLTDGIIHLYSRETTLKEQVHISQIGKYMELLMKNC